MGAKVARWLTILAGTLLLFGFFNGMLSIKMHKSISPQNVLNYVYVPERSGREGSDYFVRIKVWLKGRKAPDSVIVHYVKDKSEGDILLTRIDETTTFAGYIGGTEKGKTVKYFFKVFSSEGVFRIPERGKELYFKVTFKGRVPRWILLSHILLMFGSVLILLHAFNTGVKLIFEKSEELRKKLVKVTLAGWFAFTISAVVIGPMLTYNTYGPPVFAPWPFGHDLADTKSLYNILYWGIFLIVARKSSIKTALVLFFVGIAITTLVYVMPHGFFF